MKKIKKGEVEFIVIGIEKNWNIFKISSTNYVCYSDENDEWQAIPPRLDSEYKIYSTYSNLTEEECETLVEWVDENQHYVDYIDFSISDITAKESLKTLIISEYDVDEEYYDFLILLPKKLK